MTQPHRPGRDIPLLETQRLYMRPVRISDASMLYRLHTDPLVVELTSAGTAMTRAQSDERLRLYLREWQEYGFGFFIVYEKQANGDLIFAGRCGLRSLDRDDVELGYCFTMAASGRGLATEAAQQLVDFAFFACGMRRLVGLVRPANAPSVRVLHKIGFAYHSTGTYRDAVYRRYELAAPLPRPS